MRKSARQEYVFGEAGTKEIEYLGDMPAVFGPFCTRKIYRFRLGKNPRLVDVRDLPGLTKAAGRKKLRDINEPEKEKAPKAAPDVPVVEPVEVEEPEGKEVDNGIT